MADLVRQIHECLGNALPLCVHTWSVAYISILLTPSEGNTHTRTHSSNLIRIYLQTLALEQPAEGLNNNSFERSRRTRRHVPTFRRLDTPRTETNPLETCVQLVFAARHGGRTGPAAKKF